MVIIEKISENLATNLCEEITADLPEYFGLEEANKNYFTGVGLRFNLAAKIDSNYVGLISIDFPYANNANIYWLGVVRNYQGQGVGNKLIQAAIDFALTKGAQTMTVETLSPTESDENYFKTYNFYKSIGFMPLFDLKPMGYQWNMVYMVKLLNM